MRNWRRAVLWVGVPPSLVFATVAGNQVLTGDGFSPTWTAVAVMSAALTYGLQHRLTVADPREVLRVQDRKGDAPRLEEIAPGQFGVLISDYSAVRLARDRDSTAEDMLAESPCLVIAAGPPLAGVTSVVLAPLVRFWPRRRALVFVDPSVEEITDGYRLGCWYAQRGERSLLWLEHLTGTGMTTLATVIGPGPIPDQVSIIATTAEMDWPHTLAGPAWPLWQQAQHLEVGALTAAEETALRADPRLAAVVPALDAGERLLGRLLVARGPGRAALTDYGHRGAQIALLRLCIDWARSQISLALSSEHLVALYPLYWRQAHHVGASTPVPVGDLSQAQSELTSRSAATRWTAWLTNTGQGLHPHPLLVDIANTESEPVGWVAPTGLWTYLASALPHAELRRLGMAQLASLPLAGRPFRAVNRCPQATIVTPAPAAPIYGPE